MVVTDVIEVVVAITLVLSGQSGIKWYIKKRNGGKNSHSSSDRMFFRDCFKEQANRMEELLENDRSRLEVWMMQNLKE